MVPYLGDFAEDATVYMPFNTFTSDDPSASSTITNLADADIKVHKDGSVTQIVTDGATVAIDFDSITGNHLITVDTSVHADYATGSDYHVRIEGTTVDGATVNAWVGHFSIQNRYSAGALRPTTAGRTLDVTATGAAGIDWGNVENQSTAVDLSATDIQLADTVTTLTNKTGFSLTATTGLGNQTANITGNLTGSVGSVTGAVGSVTGAVGSVTGAVGSVTATVTADVDTIKTGTIAHGGGTVTFPTGTLANTTNITGGTVTTATNVTTVNGFAAGAIDAAAIADAAIDNATFAADVGTTAYATNNIALAANKALDDAMVETTGAPAITGTFRAALEWMFALSRNKIEQTATTTTLYADDTTTPLATSSTTDDATTYTRNEWST